MASVSVTSEIIESEEGSDPVHYSNHLSSKSRKGNQSGDLLPKPERCIVEDDINKLIEAIDLRTLSRSVGSPRKNPQKRPIRVGVTQGSGFGISETVTLKQALRGQCISQASEMAAMKRLSKPAGLSGVSEAGKIKRLYREVVVEANETGLHSIERESVIEISISPEKDAAASSKIQTDFTKILLKESLDRSYNPTCVVQTTVKFKTQASSEDTIATNSLDKSCETSTSDPGVEQNMNSKLSTNSSGGFSETSILSASPPATKPIWKMNCTKRKIKQSLTLRTSNICTEGQTAPICTNLDTFGCQVDEFSRKNATNESVAPASCVINVDGRLTHKDVNFESNSVLSPNTSNEDRTMGAKSSESSRSKDEGDCSQSSKSSIGEYSSSTSISEDSYMSFSSFHGSRPHMSRDSRWEAIRQVEKLHGRLGLKHFKLLRRLGGGDIGTVYLAELSSAGCLFALKIMDNDFLASRKKLSRAQTEREIMQMLDHPFLPTLYTHFTTNRLSCLVMEHCPGGDLHVLRQKQPCKSFSEQAARFYTAEVLLALEYLHMLGVVYRDLKPENILVREDGHIMLSDFDLSLRCAVNPTLLKLSPPPNVERGKRQSGPCADSVCIDPLCMQPSWVHVPCFTPRFLPAATKTRKLKSETASQVSPLPQLVAEPTSARSNSFVGTHEYLAPEIIKGEGHGSAVDWWTLGIFLYELLFGRTPFKGPGNEDTLANVVTWVLKFPESPLVSFHARDLIRGLLVKEPQTRLGSVRGASEIKQHPFFEGLNWALIRCAMPPQTPKAGDIGCIDGSCLRKENNCPHFRTHEEGLDFELF